MPFEQEQKIVPNIKSFERGYGQEIFGGIGLQPPTIQDDSLVKNYSGVAFYPENPSLEFSKIGMVDERFISFEGQESAMIKDRLYGNEPQENYLPEDIRQKLKDNYGVCISANPTEEEGKKVFGMVIKKIAGSTNSIISTQDSILSKLDAKLKKIDELQKDWE